MITSGKVNLKETLEQTMCMWNEIAEYPMIDKKFALKALCYDTEFYSNCPVCEYIVRKFGFDIDRGFLYPQCDKCPLDWKEVNKLDDKKASQCIKSYYGLWSRKYMEYTANKKDVQLKSLKLYAIRIACLAEEKLDELEENDV
jgi:hypothetical protein